MAEKIYVDFGIWGVMRKVAVGVVVAAIFTGLAVWYVPIFKQTTSLQKEIEIKRTALLKEQEKHQNYMDQIHGLRTDPVEIEREVRTKLKLIKPDEVIYVFEGNKPK